MDESVPHSEALAGLIADIVLHARAHEKQVYTSKPYWKHLPDPLFHQMHICLNAVLTRLLPACDVVVREVDPVLSICQFVITDPIAVANAAMTRK
jgi:hypothetical protein